MADWDDHEAKRQVRAEKKVAELEKLGRDEVIRALLSHSNGRAFIWWIFEITGALGQNPFTGNALTTAFRAGEQNVGQQVLAQILEVYPEGFLGMMQERNDATRRRSDPAGRDTGTGSDSDPDSG